VQESGWFGRQTSRTANIVDTCRRLETAILSRITGHRGRNRGWQPQAARCKSSPHTKRHYIGSCRLRRQVMMRMAGLVLKHWDTCLYHSRAAVAHCCY